jgi:hypothetical protein
MNKIVNHLDYFHYFTLGCGLNMKFNKIKVSEGASIEDQTIRVLKEAITTEMDTTLLDILKKQSHIIEEMKDDFKKIKSKR